MEIDNEELQNINDTLDYIISRFSSKNLDNENFENLLEIEKKSQILLITNINYIEKNPILLSILSKKSDLNEIKKEYSKNKTETNIVNLAIYFMINNELDKVKLLSEKHPEVNLSPLLNIIIDSKQLK